MKCDVEPEQPYVHVGNSEFQKTFHDVKDVMVVHGLDAVPHKWQDILLPDDVHNFYDKNLSVQIQKTKKNRNLSKEEKTPPLFERARI